MSENGNPPVVDLAGYPSVEELAKGYRASSEEGKKNAQALEVERQRASQLEQILLQQGAANPRQSIPDRSSPEDRLAQFGVPTDALDQFFNQRLERVLQPIMQAGQGRNNMLATYGDDYGKFEADVARHIQSDTALNQRYQRMFQSDPEGAMEYAFLKFGEAKRKASPPPADVRADTSKAQIPNGRAGETQRQASDAQDGTAKAWDHFQKTGQAGPYAQARLRKSIPDSFFSQ